MNRSRRMKRTPAPGKRSTRVARRRLPASSTANVKDQTAALASPAVRHSGSAAPAPQRQALAQQPALERQNATFGTQLTVAKGQQVAAGLLEGAADEMPADEVRDVDFLKSILDAVKHAVDMWKSQAHFQDLRINAISAIGTPGCLDGPELEMYVCSAPQVAGLDGVKAEFRDAAAEGVSDCFKAWQDMVTVPGLPWYPAFAAWPGPSAPPMPNIPTPLIACPSINMAKITTPGSLEAAMFGALPDALQVEAAQAAMEALARSLSMAFAVWLPAAMIQNVLGKGPVPSFAPPYVPVGPVVGGDNIAAPGHLITAPPLATIPPILT